MPALAGRTTYIPGKGAYTRSKSGKAKTFVGKGSAPSGSKKAPERSYLEVPTVTKEGSKVTTSGFHSHAAAKKAVRATRRRERALTYLERGMARRKRLRASEGRPKTTPSPYKPPTLPTSKPKTFQGHPTAGTPTLKSLRSAASSGTLKLNKAGFQTTPQVRKVASDVKQLRSKAVKAGPLPGLGPEESRVARKVLKTGAKLGATKKEKLAAAETGLVESGFKNLSYGDADSAGWRQERSMYYPNPTNVKASAKRFFTETKTDTGGGRGRGETAGQLAQTVQASAFPERYDEHKPEAAAILHAFNKGTLKPAQQKKLQQAQQKAKGLGLTNLMASASKNVGPAPKKVVTRFKAAKQAMKEVQGLPYVWGGGHGSPTSSPTGGGLDCSGAVGYVLNKIHAMKGSATSGDMGRFLKPGPGLLTVFYNGEHTFLRLGNEYWGTSVGDSGAGGLGPHPTPSASYLASYNVGHVPGMGKKQLLQMGFKAQASQSFPGMTLSSSGTSATINPGAGATQSKPGFSKQPIQLTPRQKYHRITKKLEKVGIGGEPATEEISPTLKALERKYS